MGHTLCLVQVWLYASFHSAQRLWLFALAKLQSKQPFLKFCKALLASSLPCDPKASHLLYCLWRELQACKPTVYLVARVAQSQLFVVRVNVAISLWRELQESNLLDATAGMFQMA